LFSVEIKPRTDDKLVPGALISVTFPSPPNADTVRIPNDALIERRGSTGVFVLDDRSPPAHAVFRRVLVKKLLGKDVWLAGGLSPGERIIAEGAYFIEDGERVTPIPPPPGVVSHE
jgi:multidrug efflux pump subunit AcrA (membrane-fusion protein)